MDDLLKLAERVEAITSLKDRHNMNLELAQMFDNVPEAAWIHPSSLAGIWTMSSWANGKTWGTCPSYMTSLDAAQALKDATLSGWVVRISQIRFGFWLVELWRGDVSFKEPADAKGTASEPSQAYAAAILRANAQENNNG